MKIQFAALIFALSLSSFLVGGPAYAREKPIPKTVEGFTAYMADRFAEAMPGDKVTVRGPLQLEVVVPAGPHTVNLNRVWDFCERDRRHCRKEVDGFLENMPGTMTEFSGREIKPADIRAVVRSSAYAAQVHRMAANGPDHDGIVRPIAGDVWMIVVVDRPHGIEPLNHGDMAKLGLTEDQAVALAIKNVAAALPPIEADTHPVQQTSFKMVGGDFYDSSRMLLHDSWAKLSAEMGGHLVIAVPNPDLLIYGNGSGNAERIVFGGFVRMVLGKADKPISADLFEWTPGGWKVVKPE